MTYSSSNSVKLRAPSFSSGTVGSSAPASAERARKAKTKTNKAATKAKNVCSGRSACNPCGSRSYQVNPCSIDYVSNFILVLMVSTRIAKSKVENPKAKDIASTWSRKKSVDNKARKMAILSITKTT